MERMLKIFKDQISEFDKLLLSNKTVLFKRNNRSYQVSLEDMIYDKDYLPVYEHYSMLYQSLKEIEELINNNRYVGGLGPHPLLGGVENKGKIIFY